MHVDLDHRWATMVASFDQDSVYEGIQLAYCTHHVSRVARSVIILGILVVPHL
ncbi:hypothetical protein [Alloactinosynnema sp. L-07]|nr:hypothetical protein [Alloactinosynnema sp. L-07]